MSSPILGLWDGHDAGAACLVDGRVVAAVNEERLTRRKLEVAFPVRSIELCLTQAGLRPADIRTVAASTTDPAKTLERLLPWTKERYYRVRRRQVPPGAFTGLTKAVKRELTTWQPRAWSRQLSRRLLAGRLRSLDLGHAALRVFDHHECHAISAAHGSRFAEASVVTLDGLGDGACATVWRWANGRLELLARSLARHSLGVFFEHVTERLNMRELEDEGKVMALADFAADVPEAENALRDLFDVRDGRLVARRSPRQLAAAVARAHWSLPNERLARMAQNTVEVVASALVRDAIRLTGCGRVALAGGVASNIKANARIRHLPEVEDVYVFPHMGDGGLALGAAIAAYAQPGSGEHIAVDPRALGPAFSEGDCHAALAAHDLPVVRPADLAAAVAGKLTSGQIVYWFQGRMEYGPRALGQRSVLARPDSLEIKDRLNLVLKRRVWYQPFCPSILEEDAAALFADWAVGGTSSREMTMAYMTTPAARPRLAGVVNVDGSCRPQIITGDDDSPFSRLLRLVRETIGVGALLNTSLNIHGEPLVCTPAEAVDVFRRSGADALALGPFLVTQTGYQP